MYVLQSSLIAKGNYESQIYEYQQKGLSKMKRHHIHCSEDFPGCGKVISGMRSTCQIAIFVDVKKACEGKHEVYQICRKKKQKYSIHLSSYLFCSFADGIKFYRSENNVILTPGDDDGFLKPKYFIKVLDLTTSK